MNRQNWPDQYLLQKAAELHRLLAARSCVFMLGGAGAGKSQTWKTLARAVTMEPHQAACLNPKAVPVNRLYGCVSHDVAPPYRRGGGPA